MFILFVGVNLYGNMYCFTSVDVKLDRTGLRAPTTPKSKHHYDSAVEELKAKVNGALCSSSSLTGCDASHQHSGTMVGTAA